MPHLGGTMETIEAYQLGRAGVGIAEKIGYDEGYKQGVRDALYEMGDFIDPDTLTEIETELLGDEQ